MTVLDRTCSLEILRWFDAVPEKLFDAWLHESWGEWLAPRAMFCTSSIVNPRVGGRYSATMRMQEGRDVTVSGSYLEIARPTRLVFTRTGDHAGEETRVTLTFRAKNDGAEMILKQEGFITEELRDRHKADWTGRNGAFDKLARFFEGLNFFNSPDLRSAFP